MMSQLPILPILLPLFGSILLLFFRYTGVSSQRVLSLLLSIALVLLSLVVLRSTQDQAYQIYLLGNWLAPFGIVLVLDKLAAVMLVLTAILALAALLYAISDNNDKQAPHFHVLFHMQLFGINGAFLTGDLFNLFVFFEVLLLASYGLLLHGGGRLRTKAGLHYVVINLIGSSLFLFAVGTLYGVLGTLNMADLAVKISQAPAENHGIIAAAALLLLVVFAIKAALFPLYLWLPAAYSQASAAVAALFAIMTKVGVYAIIRVHGSLFNDEAGALAFLHTDILLWLGMLTALLAAFGVWAAERLKQQVAYLILASVSLLLIAVGINNEHALSAGVFYLIHSTLIGAAMFLLADIIAKGRGALADNLINGAAVPSPILLGSLFFIMAVAITGIPPLSGFIGKLLLLEAALNQPYIAWIFASILISSLLMVIALAQSGSTLFYQAVTDKTARETRPQPMAIISLLMLLLLSPAMVIWADPIKQFTDSVARQLTDTPAYIHAVLMQTANHGGI